jgi:DNA-binding transcriptional ArsR family regulator
VDRKTPARQVDFVLGSDDVTRLRFGISPGNELSSGVCALQAPQGAPLQWGWLKAVSHRLPAAAWDVITTVIPPTGYYPDFLATDPAWDLTPEAEAAAMRRVDLDRVVRDLTKVAARATGKRRRDLEAMLTSPAQARTQITDAWVEVWEAVLAPHWDHLRRLLEADVARRARQVAETGMQDMIDKLHERVTWTDGRVRVTMRIWSEEVLCQGSGLLLVPTVLGAPWCSVVTEPPATPALFYPAAGMSPSWPANSQGRSTALVKLLGAGRGSVLMSLDIPRSTSDVARTCDLAISTASHHLAVLRDARLVEAHRAGSSVYHSRTPLAESLVAP